MGIRLVRYRSSVVGEVESVDAQEIIVPQRLDA